MPFHETVKKLANGGEVPLYCLRCVLLLGEKTRNGILSTLRIRGELGSAVVLDDIQDGVLAQPEPLTYFPVRLASSIIRSLPELVT
jgi:hypothetical protein